MSTVIKVENLSKKYIISHESQESYTTLRDVMTNTFKTIGYKALHPFKHNNFEHPSKEEFWALKDVTFEVKQGERIGIIGRNGAGKSTLLKLLSRITEPTSGSISLKGRVSSLLEVGTGFHPELTGRENIYLNGAILGMSKSEIKKKFDEIVAFSEVEKFLDTPVKRYSSGMQVRLAFAVAAHLEPEILLVDEVLAVGDAQFQKKCLGKMEEVAGEGRTILFVSHNMNAVEQLCSSCIYLDEGTVQLNDTDVRDVIKKYLFGENQLIKSEWIRPKNMVDNPWFNPTRFALTDKQGNNIYMPVSNNDDYCVTIEAEIGSVDSALTIGYALYSEDGSLLFWSYFTDDWDHQNVITKKGFIKLSSQIPKRLLNEGVYKLELLGSLHFIRWLFEPGSTAPSIDLTIQGGLSDSPYWMAKRPGLLAPLLNWTIEY